MEVERHGCKVPLEGQPTSEEQSFISCEDVKRRKFSDVALSQERYLP